MTPLLPLLLLFTFGTFTQGVDIDYDIEGNIYVVDAGRDLVTKWSPMGDSIAAVGGFGRGEEEFDRPVGIFARGGADIYVADYNNHRIQRFDRRLNLVGSIHYRESGDDRLRFGYPLDVAVSRQGEIHILDGENRRVLVLDMRGGFVRSFGDVGSGAGRLVDPQRLELDGADNVYVLDNGAIHQFDPFGGWLRSLPTPTGTIRSFSIDRDTLTLATDSLLYFRDLEQKEWLERMTSRLEGESSAFRRIGDMIYSVERVRLAVRKLQGTPVR